MRLESAHLQLTAVLPAKQPIVIAGPCSAESEEQLLRTAIAVAAIPGVTAFRAGIWKPRTRPNSFEGSGVRGLKWLQLAKAQTGLPVAVEVANAYHVQEALKHDVDILWIGARTTASPFSIQEIAEALNGTDMTVFVKNPLNPDLQLWIGALERLNHAGLTRLGAIHRGFSTYDRSPYRNPPLWSLPIELKRLLPELPLICDPSHIGGKREYVPALCQWALDIAMDGLMIEVHMNPDEALGDKAQQITPAALTDLLGVLQYRKPGGDLERPEEFLVALRGEIDRIDHELLELVSRRIDIVKEIGGFKKAHNMTVLQVDRWTKMMDERLEFASRIGLDESLAKEICQLLHERSIRIQSDLISQLKVPDPIPQE